LPTHGAVTQGGDRNGGLHGRAAQARDSAQPSATRGAVRDRSFRGLLNLLV
jgi:hypothetical protein